jgi:hypothetical protein
MSHGDIGSYDQCIAAGLKKGKLVTSGELDQRDNDRQPPSVIHIRSLKGLLVEDTEGITSTGEDKCSSVKLGVNGGDTEPPGPSDGRHLDCLMILTESAANEPRRAKVMDCDDCNQKPVENKGSGNETVPKTFDKTWPTRLKSLITRVDNAIRWKPPSPQPNSASK